MLFIPPSMPFMDPVPEAEAQSNSTNTNSTSSGSNATSTDTTYPAETPPIIGSANYLAQTNQQAHQYSGNTPAVYVTFNEDVPTVGSLVNIVSVFPNAQSGVSKTSVNVPYTLTYPGGTQGGTLTHINTSNLYDMVLSINNAPVVGHYVFQTELISTSFDVYAPGEQVGSVCSTLSNSSSIEDARQCLGGTYNVGGGLNAWSGITTSAYVNSTSSTGRTLEITTTGIQPGTMISVLPQVQYGLGQWDYTGVTLANWGPNDLEWKMLTYDDPILKIPIGSAFDDTKKIQIFYRLTTTSNFPYAIMIGGSGNVDGLTTPISVPSISGTGDTTPPVLNMPANQNFTTDGISQTLVFQNDPATYLFPSNSTGYYYVVAGVTATDDVGVMSGPTCTAVAPNGNTWSVPPNNYHTVWFNSQFGTTTITCTATDAAGNVGTGTFTVNVSLVSLTINSLTISEFYTTSDELKIKYNPTGDSPTYTCLAVQVIKPDGTIAGITYDTACVGSEPAHNFEGFIIDPFNASGWTMKICATDYDACAEQNFTISFASLNATSIIPSTNATSTIPPTNATSTVLSEIVIPSWIKNNAGWWASNQIDDRSFVSGLQWLISNGVMHIPPTEQGAGSDDVIPGWIKNNAGWWADDLIDDRNFVTGLQWLITNGIMVIG